MANLHLERINELIEKAETLETEPTEENVANALELRKQLREIPDPKPVDEKPQLLPFTDPWVDGHPLMFYLKSHVLRLSPP